MEPLDDSLRRTMRSADAIASGHSRDDLRGAPFMARSHGLVRRTGEDADPLTLQLSDALAVLTGACAIGGWSALFLHGNHWFDGLDREGEQRKTLVHCPAGTQLRQRDGIDPFRGLVRADELCDVDGLPLATMARATFDEMRMAHGVREAVVVLDLAISTTSLEPSTDLHRIVHVLETHHKVRGLIQAKKAVGHLSTRSASPWETRTRLLAEIDAGLPRLLVNVPIFTLQGRLMGVADLLDEEAGLVIESDGGHHRENVHHTDDNRREETFERAGVVVVRVTSLDHGARWDTVRRISSARRDGLASTRREWTTDRPDWWWSWPPGRRWD